MKYIVSKTLDIAGCVLAVVGRSFAGGEHVHGGTQFGLIALFIVLEIVVHIAIAIQSPRDAETPIDEREDLIDLKACSSPSWSQSS
jgi:hypothetical protein